MIGFGFLSRTRSGFDSPSQAPQELNLDLWSPVDGQEISNLGSCQIWYSSCFHRLCRSYLLCFWPLMFIWLVISLILSCLGLIVIWTNYESIIVDINCEFWGLIRIHCSNTRLVSLVIVQFVLWIIVQILVLSICSNTQFVLSVIVQISILLFI